jgi:hypothetical protein
MALARRSILIGIGLLACGAGAFALVYRPFPSDRTPEGAYMRIARAAVEDNPLGFFAYLETEAQWACYTLRDTRRKASLLVAAHYPEPQRSQLLEEYKTFAEAPDGSDVFAYEYRAKRWSHRLRKDLSGVARVERDPSSDRATVVTARGTRWPFRLRENGIWGLTIFTAELAAEAEKATRDLAVVESAAADYDRLRDAK